MNFQLYQNHINKLQKMVNDNYTDSDSAETALSEVGAKVDGGSLASEQQKEEQVVDDDGKYEELDWGYLMEDCNQNDQESNVEMVDTYEEKLYCDNLDNENNNVNDDQDNYGFDNADEEYDDWFGFSQDVYQEEQRDEDDNEEPNDVDGYGDGSVQNVNSQDDKNASNEEQNNQAR